MDGIDTADTIEQNRRLRRTMRDLVALSTLPAIWAGLSTEGILDSLCNALFNTLSLDLIYVRVGPSSGNGVLEVARSGHQPNGFPVEKISAALARLVNVDDPERPSTIPDPFGNRE